MGSLDQRRATARRLLLLRSSTPAVAWDPDALALFARMDPEPDAAGKSAINAYFTALKTSEMYSTVDATQIIAGGDVSNALLNIVGDIRNLSVNGTMSLDGTIGMYGDGSSGYWTGWGLPADLENYLQDSAHVSFFITRSRNMIGHIGRAASASTLAINVGYGSVSTRINGNASQTIGSGSGVPTNNEGLWSFVRVDSTTHKVYHNGVLLATLTRTSVTPTASAITVGRGNTNYCSDTFGLVMIGGAVSDAQVAAHAVAATELMEAFGYEAPAAPEEFTLSLLSATTVPDVAGSEAGKGFTCTGLARDPIDGTWWVGNDGRPGTVDASVVHLSADFSTVLANVTLNSLSIGPTNFGIQGVVYDETDDTIFFVAKDRVGSGSVIVHIEKDGSLIETFSGSLLWNGLGIIDNELLVLKISPDELIRRNKTTGAATGVVWNVPPGDQIFVDAAGRIMYTRDAGGLLVVYEFDVNGVLRLTKSITLEGAGSIEGAYIHDGTLYIMNDAYFHGTGTLLNQVLTYDASGI